MPGEARDGDSDNESRRKGGHGKAAMRVHLLEKEGRAEAVSHAIRPRSPSGARGGLGWLAAVESLIPKRQHRIRG